MRLRGLLTVAAVLTAAPASRADRFADWRSGGAPHAEKPGGAKDDEKKDDKKKNDPPAAEGSSSSGPSLGVPSLGGLGLPLGLLPLGLPLGFPSIGGVPLPLPAWAVGAGGNSKTTGGASALLAGAAKSSSEEAGKTAKATGAPSTAPLVAAAKTNDDKSTTPPVAAVKTNHEKSTALPVASGQTEAPKAATAPVADGQTNDETATTPTVAGARPGEDPTSRAPFPSTTFPVAGADASGRDHGKPPLPSVVSTPWYSSSRVLVAGAFTLVAGAGTVAGSLWTLRARADFDAANGQPGRTARELDDLHARTRTLGIATTALGGLTAVGLGLTTLFLVRDAHPTPSPVVVGAFADPASFGLVVGGAL